MIGVARTMRAGRLRLTLWALVLLLACVAPAASQDQFLRGVALTEAVSPVGLLLLQGVDDPLEASLLGGAVLLHTVPSAVLLVAESSGNAELTRIARLAGAGAGFFTAAGTLATGVAVLAGAFPELGWQPYAGSLMAVSVPALFAGFVDLVPYAVEEEPGSPATP